MEKRKRTKKFLRKKNEQTYGYDNLLFHIHPYPSIFKHIRVLMWLMTLKNSIDLRYVMVFAQFCSALTFSMVPRSFFNGRFCFFIHSYAGLPSFIISSHLFHLIQISETNEGKEKGRNLSRYSFFCSIS